MACTISSTLGEFYILSQDIQNLIALTNSHALQLRQAKLSFPSVFLIVGCNSDEQVAAHKNKCVMTHAER
jgi:hypothetical protein